jgi:hypothetical protein
MIIFRLLRVCWCGAPSLTRSRVCTFQFLPGIASSAFLRSESHGTREHILLSLFFRLPQHGGPGSCIYLPQELGSSIINSRIGFKYIVTASSPKDGVVGRQRYACRVLTDWMLNYCWPSTAKRFLVLSRTGPMTTFYPLTALGPSETVMQHATRLYATRDKTPESRSTGARGDKRCQATDLQTLSRDNEWSKVKLSP